MLWTVDVWIINPKSVYTWHSSLFNCNANIAFMVLNFKHKFISNLNLDGLIENNCSLLPVWELIRCIQTMLFIQMKMIPEGNCSDLARLANLYLKKNFWILLSYASFKPFQYTTETSADKWVLYWNFQPRWAINEKFCRMVVECTSIYTHTFMYTHTHTPHLHFSAGAVQQRIHEI